MFKSRPILSLSPGGDELNSLSVEEIFHCRSRALSINFTEAPSPVDLIDKLINEHANLSRRKFEARIFGFDLYKIDN